jgi:hypothetical protein
MMTASRGRDELPLDDQRFAQGYLGFDHGEFYSWLVSSTSLGISLAAGQLLTK